MPVYGNQNPTSCVYLSTPDDLKRGKGAEAKAIYEKSGNTLMEWQELLLNQMMAVDTESLWVHSKFAYSISRRNGKSESCIARVLYGLEAAEVGLYTAHRSHTSHNFFERIEKALDNMGYIRSSTVKKGDLIDEALLYDSIRTLGAEHIHLRATGGIIDFRTRTQNTALGTGVDYEIIDEAQEYRDDQETALKYVVSDSKNPQIIMCGTPPTAVSGGTVFSRLRDEVFSGKAKYTGWAEWSVEEQCDPWDEEAWIRTNPSYGVILTKRKIEAEIGEDTLDFNIQRLGYWFKYKVNSAIPLNVWSRSKINFDKSMLCSKLSVGIKFGVSGENVALSIACTTIDDKVFVQCLKMAPVTAMDGINWIADILEHLDYDVVAVDGKSGQTLITELFKSRKLKGLTFPKVNEIIHSNTIFEQALYNNTLCHAEQKPVDIAVTNCKKRPIGKTGGFGYESILEGSDIAILDSIILAHWARKQAKKRKPQKVIL